MKIIVFIFLFFSSKNPRESQDQRSFRHFQNIRARVPRKSRNEGKQINQSVVGGPKFDLIFHFPRVDVTVFSFDFRVIHLIESKTPLSG